MSEARKVPDPAFLRGATMRRMSRRDLLRYAGVGAGALSLSSILAACGTQPTEAATGQPTASDQPGSSAWWAAQTAGANVNFTNWPQYIDNFNDEDGVKHFPTLDAFTEATGIDVTYRTDIQGNAEFYAAIRPSLEAGQATGNDIIVITNGTQLSELIELGFLIALDVDGRPNFDANADPTIVDPAYDPGNAFTMAWQSGFTGIAWNTNYIDREITSMNDLLDPAFAGKIGMMNNDDAATFSLLAVGVEPETSTPGDWEEGVAWMQAQKDSGVVRNYYGQPYLTALENEDIWITMAWSGDILIDQLYFGRTELQFTIPEEGGVIWTDNMCIPQGAENPLGALQLMDWYYKPEIAAQLTEYNNYVGPVTAAKAIVEADAEAATGDDKATLEAVASSPFVFPTPEIAAKVHSYRVLSAEEQQQWNDLFIPIWQG